MGSSRLKDWVVKILAAEDAEAAEGTGFWAAEGGYVLTCLHVVEDMASPWIAYGEQKSPVQVIETKGDIVLLKAEGLEGPPAPLGQDWQRDDIIDSLGYQYEGTSSRIGVFPMDGTIAGEGEFEGLDTIVLKEAIHVKPGSSGAPALNRRTGRVIGLISHKWQENEIAFFLPLAPVLDQWAELKPRFFPVKQNHLQQDIFDHYDIFVGREDDLAEIERYLQGEGGEYYLLQGGPGIGKSALMAHLARMAAERRLGADLTYMIFFIREEGSRNSPELFLDSLNEQLMDILGGWQERPSTLGEKIELQQRLWAEVEGKLLSSNRLLVLIDGLDEAGQQGLQKIINTLPSSLPTYCSWIISSRPLPDVLNAAPTTHLLRQAKSHYLGRLEAKDVRELLRHYNDPIERDEPFIEKVLKQTRGEPLYLRYVCEDIAAWGEKAEANLTNIPNEVSDYFLRQFKTFRQRSKKADDRSVPLEIFKILTVTYSGLTAEELAGILDVPLYEIEESLELIGRFLLGQNRFELMHLQFRRTVQKQLVGPRGKEAVLERVLAYCEENWDKELPNETYALRYYLRHLQDAKQYQAMFDLCEAGYLTTKLGRLINPELLEEDYQSIFDVCQAEEDMGALLHWGYQRAQISNQVIALRDIEAIPATIGRLADLGDREWWERGIGLCALIPEVEGKVKGLLALCNALEPEKKNVPRNVFERILDYLTDIASPKRKDELSAAYVVEICRWGELFLEQASIAAENIVHDRSRANALAAVAQAYGQLSEAAIAAEILAKARAAAEKIDDDGSRSYALAAVAQAYGQLSEAAIAADGLAKVRAAAEKIDDDGSRSEALAAVAQAYGQLSEAAIAADGLAKVRAAAEKIDDDGSRSYALAAVAQAYGQLSEAAIAAEILAKVRAAAEKIDDDGSRSYALAAVAQAYGQLSEAAIAADGLAKVRAAAEKIDDWSRSEALAAVAQAYGQLSEAAIAAEILAKARAAAEKIDDDWSRSEALAAVAQAYGQQNKMEQALMIFNRISDHEIIQVAKTVFAASDSLSLKNNFYKVLPLAAQRTSQVYLKVIEAALPSLARHLSADEVQPVLSFLEKQWV